jgi:hypothetical protein
MKLKEIYARDSDKEENKKDKKVIGDDAYAICDFIERLINKLEHARISAL